MELVVSTCRDESLGSAWLATTTGSKDQLMNTGAGSDVVINLAGVGMLGYVGSASSWTTLVE